MEWAGGMGVWLGWGWGVNVGGIEVGVGGRYKEGIGCRVGMYRRWGCYGLGVYRRLVGVVEKWEGVG